MPAPQRSIVIMDCNGSRFGDYKLKEAKNIVEWPLGEYFTKEEVQHIINRGIQVTIKPLS